MTFAQLAQLYGDVTRKSRIAFAAMVKRLLLACIVIVIVFVYCYTLLTTNRKFDMATASINNYKQSPIKDLEFSLTQNSLTWDRGVELNLQSVLEVISLICKHYEHIVLIETWWLVCLTNLLECKQEQLSQKQTLHFAISTPHWYSVTRTSDKPPLNIHIHNDSVVEIQLNSMPFLSIIAVRMDIYDDYVKLNVNPERAMLRFTIQNTIINSPNDQYFLRVPEDIDFYLWQYNRSRLIYCRQDLASSLKLQHPEWQNKPQLPIKRVVPDMKGFRDILYKLRVTPLLFGGTALGWYRECSIIPYTTDTDFATFIEEYKDELIEKFKWHRKYVLMTIYGLINDSLELSVAVAGRKIDLFFINREKTGSGSWVGGMMPSLHRKLKWTYRERLEPWLRDDDVCTGVLHGTLFMVPCKVTSFLEDDYGPDWHLPHHESNYVWYESHHNVHNNGQWPDSIWSQVYRIF